MAAENTPQNANNGNKDRKRKRYLPHSKSVKKGAYPLRPGVQGFFITCDGGRERQASQEAINVIDTFYEELLDEEDSGAKHAVKPSKPLNKKIKFADSDSSSDDDESGQPKDESTNDENRTNEAGENQNLEAAVEQEKDATQENQTIEEDRNSKKQHLETSVPKSENVVNDETPKVSIDELIEDELKELKDRSKRRFVSLDSGCNGVVFIQMLKRDGDPGPSEIVKHMMTSAAATRKHMSRFILRVLPVELTCYASAEEITRAVKPLMDQYFPAEAQTPLKFAVLFDARANTGIDRMSIINAVAKSVPGPHKVDLNNPDKSIVVQIAKTVCSIGVVEKYKELSKYNLRQLTSPKA